MSFQKSHTHRVLSVQFHALHGQYKLYCCGGDSGALLGHSLSVIGLFFLAI